MVKFCVPNRLMSMKKTSSGLIRKFTIKKKNRTLFESPFLNKTFLFFAFLSHLETSHFLYRRSINEKPPLQSNEAQ